MGGIAEAVSILISILQLTREANAAASELAAMIAKAKAEGRDLTDEELDAARATAMAARAGLANP
jgi:hypothetical protein